MCDAPGNFRQTTKPRGACLPRGLGMFGLVTTTWIETYCARSYVLRTIAGMSTALDAGTVPPIRQPYRLLIARLEAGLKQEELAELMGCGRTVVSNAEKGKGPVRKIVLNAWALATGVPVGWLEHGVGDMTPPDNPPTGEEECARRDSNPQPSDLETHRQRRAVSRSRRQTLGNLPVLSPVKSPAA